jgi:signal transduction histidine kinase
MLRHAAGKGVEVIVELAERLPPCMLAVTELELALVNLVVNAKDALNGSGKIVVRTYIGGGGADAAHANSRVCVAVEDDGPGMPEDVQRRAFEPYFTTKGERGNGFGLAQVYGFMQQVGGEARIESRAGQGTKVVLMFAAAAAQRRGSQN